MGHEPPKKKRPRIQYDPSDMLDIHLRVGLFDQVVRVPKDQWGLVIENWIVAGEDVVLRCSHSNFEANILLRGGEGGYLSIRACDSAKNLPVYNCLSVMDMRREMLKDQGVE